LKIAEIMVKILKMRILLVNLATFGQNMDVIDLIINAGRYALKDKSSA